MHFIFIGRGKAQDVFRELALAAVADRLLEMRYGKWHIAGTPNIN